jgi:hypothetical protein
MVEPPLSLRVYGVSTPIISFLPIRVTATLHPLEQLKLSMLPNRGEKNYNIFY